MPRRKDLVEGGLDDEIRVRIPHELKQRALEKCREGLDYPTDLSAVVRILLLRWVEGRASTGSGRRQRRGGE